jgi:hypothetical protein
MPSLLNSNLFKRLARRKMNLLAKLCYGRFHNILPKEYSRRFPELLGDYKKRWLLTTGVSQIL